MSTVTTSLPLPSFFDPANAPGAIDVLRAHDALRLTLA